MRLHSGFHPAFSPMPIPVPAGFNPAWSFISGILRFLTPDTTSLNTRHSLPHEYPTFPAVHVPAILSRNKPLSLTPQLSTFHPPCPKNINHFIISSLSKFHILKSPKTTRFLPPELLRTLPVSTCLPPKSSPATSFSFPASNHCHPRNPQNLRHKIRIL